MSAAETRRRPTSRRLFQAAGLVVLTGLGLVGTVVVAIDWLQALDTWSWERATCGIVDSRVVPAGADGGHRLEVSYRYRHRGEEYAGDAYRHGGATFDEISDAQRAAARFAPGAEVACWVDPDEPARSYLRRPNLWRGLLILLPLLFVAVGAGALWLLFRLPLRRASGTGGAGGPLAEKVAAFKPALLGVGFFGVFFLFGAGVLIPFFVRPALQVLDARSWRPVPCEVLSSGVRTHPGDDGATYSVEVLYRYEIDGRGHLSSRYGFLGGSSGGYESKAEIVAGMPQGARLTCWVNPHDPYDAVVERGLTGEYLFGLIPLLFALIGLGGIVFTIVATRGMKRDAARPSWTTAGSAADALPVGPSDPIVLEPRMGPFGKLGCAIVVALAWNGVVALFVWQLVESWRAGNREWLLTLFMVPFVLVGLLLLAGIPYGLLALANPRPRLRLSRAAIPAGGSAEVIWSFRGAAGRVRRLRLWLESSLTTTDTEVHDSGISVSTRTEVLDTIQIVDRGGDVPLALGSASFTVPAGAPPTCGGDRAVSWKVRLQGTIAYWPDVMEEYEVRVLPRRDDGP